MDEQLIDDTSRPAHSSGRPKRPLPLWMAALGTVLAISGGAVIVSVFTDDDLAVNVPIPETRRTPVPSLVPTPSTNDAGPRTDPTPGTTSATNAGAKRPSTRAVDPVAPTREPAPAQPTPSRVLPTAATSTTITTSSTEAASNSQPTSASAPSSGPGLRRRRQ